MKMIYRNMLPAMLFLAMASLCQAEEVKPVAELASKAAGQAVTAEPMAQKQGDKPDAERVIKFGYVDMVRIGSESTQGKAAKAKFDSKAGKYKDQIVGKQKQLEKQKSAIQAKLPTMSPEQRAAKAKEFDKKVEEYQKFVQKAEREMQDLQGEVSRKLFLEIERVVEGYGKANGFTAISIKKDILYLASGVDVQDVTDTILKLVNEKENKK